MNRFKKMESIIIMWKIIVLFVATQVLATIMAVSLMLHEYPVGLMAANAFLLMYLFLLVGTHTQVIRLFTDPMLMFVEDHQE